MTTRDFLSAAHFVTWAIAKQVWATTRAFASVAWEMIKREG